MSSSARAVHSWNMLKHVETCWNMLKHVETCWNTVPKHSFWAASTMVRTASLADSPFRWDQPVPSEDIFRPFYDLIPLTQDKLQKGLTNFTDAANKKFLGRWCFDVLWKVGWCRLRSAGCGCSLRRMLQGMMWILSSRLVVGSALHLIQTSSLVSKTISSRFWVLWLVMVGHGWSLFVWKQHTADIQTSRIYHHRVVAWGSLKLPWGTYSFGLWATWFRAEAPLSFFVTSMMTGCPQDPPSVERESIFWKRNKKATDLSTDFWWFLVLSWGNCGCRTRVLAVNLCMSRGVSFQHLLEYQVAKLYSWSDFSICFKMFQRQL